MKKLLFTLCLLLAFASVSMADRAQYMPDIVVTEPGAAWTDVRAFATLDAARSAIGATPTTLVISEDISLASGAVNVTLPASITVKVLPGVVITLGTYDLTINGPIDAPLEQIFSENSTGDVTLTSRADPVRPEWWGATGNGTTNDTAALQSAIDAIPNDGTLLFQSGRTYVTSGLTLKSNIILSGYGATIKKVASGADSAVLTAANASNIKILGLEIDGNKANQAANGSRAGIYIYASTSHISGIVIQDCYLHDVAQQPITIDNHPVDAYYVSDVKILNNKVIDWGKTTGSLDGIELFSNTTDYEISGNLIDSDSSIGIGAGINVGEGAVNTGGVKSNGIISNNIIRDAGTNGDSITVKNEADITDVIISNNLCYNAPNNGIHIGGKNISVVNNFVSGASVNGIFVLTDDDDLTAATGAYDSYNIVVSGNIVEDSDAFGIIMIGTYGGTISNNVVNGEGGSPYYGIFVGDSYTPPATDLEATGCKNITISGNTVYNLDGGGIAVRQQSTVASAEVSGITITGNVVEDVAVNGIYVNTVEHITITGNQVKNFGDSAYGLYINAGDYVLATDNNIYDLTGTAITNLNEGSNSSIIFNSADGVYSAEEITMGATSSKILLDSADGADAKRLIMCGGGDVETTRGASIVINGNEAPSGSSSEPGAVFIYAGDVTGGDISLLTDNNQTRVFVEEGTGNVGIGDTTPSCKLDVAGAVASAVTSVSASADNTNVSGVNTLLVNTTSGNVVLGGFTGGVEGQVLHVVKYISANDATLEHDEGTTQEIYLSSAADETISAASFGGWTLVYSGSRWYEVGN